MENKYNLLYENAQLEHFERSILSGYLTEKTLAEMIDKNELSAQQRLIAEGFYDRLKARGAGLVRGAKAMGGNIKQGAQAAGNVAMGNKPNLSGLTNVRGAYQKGKAENLIANYNNNLSSTLDKYLVDLQKTGLLTNNVSKLINSLKAELNRMVVSSRSGGQIASGQRSAINVQP